MSTVKDLSFCRHKMVLDMVTKSKERNARTHKQQHGGQLITTG